MKTAKSNCSTSNSSNWDKIRIFLFQVIIKYCLRQPSISFVRHDLMYICTFSYIPAWLLEVALLPSRSEYFYAVWSLSWFRYIVAYRGRRGGGNASSSLSWENFLENLGKNSHSQLSDPHPKVKLCHPALVNLSIRPCM